MRKSACNGAIISRVRLRASAAGMRRSARPATAPSTTIARRPCAGSKRRRRVPAFLAAPSPRQGQGRVRPVHGRADPRRADGVNAAPALRDKEATGRGPSPAPFFLRGRCRIWERSASGGPVPSPARRSDRLGDNRRGVRLGGRRVHAGRSTNSRVPEDTLGSGQFEDAAGRPEQAYILTLPVPTCLSSSDADSAVGSTTNIHIYSFDSAVSEAFEGLIGQSVQVRGTPFRAYLASSRPDRHGCELDRRDLRRAYSRSR